MLLSKTSTLINLTIFPKGFVEYLSKALEAILPPKLDVDKISIIYNAKEKCIEIILPHTSISENNILICCYDYGIVVCYCQTHDHYDSNEYSTYEDLYKKVCDFIDRLFRGKIEVELTCVNKKAWLAKKYYISDSMERHIFSVENNFLFALVYPFSKRTKIVRRIDFYKD
jgi:hypothetical protein